MLDKTLESPLDYKEIKPVNSIGNQFWIFIGGLMLKLKLQNFGQLMRRTDSLKKTLMLGKMGGRERRGQQRMSWLDGITALMDLSLSKLQELVMACCSPCDVRVRHAWATELNWTEFIYQKKEMKTLFRKVFMIYFQQFWIIIYTVFWKSHKSHWYIISIHKASDNLDIELATKQNKTEKTLKGKEVNQWSCSVVSVSDSLWSHGL